jgi:MoxR-like ATPase
MGFYPQVEKMEENKSTIKNIFQMKKTLDNYVFGHDNMKRAVLLGLLSSAPTFILGRVGIAKTYTIDTLAKMLNVNYYYVLLNKYTEPDHILGILDINEYKKGRLVYHGGVVDANIVMFDEPYKSSPDVLNTLLDIILNKRVFGIKLNLLATYFASNEFNTDDDLVAFNDRLIIRVVETDYVHKFDLKKIVKSDSKTPEPILTYDDIVNLQNEVRKIAMNIDDALLDKFLDAIIELRGLNYLISDRRVKNVIHVAAANALLEGKDNIEPDDLVTAMKFTLNDPTRYTDSIKEIETIALKHGLNEIASIINKIRSHINAINLLITNTKDGTTDKNITLSTLKQELIKVQDLCQKYSAKSDTVKALCDSINIPDDIVNELLRV